MLKFDPRERFSAEQCLESSIFDDLLRNENLQAKVNGKMTIIDEKEIQENAL